MVENPASFPFYEEFFIFQVFLAAKGYFSRFIVGERISTNIGKDSRGKNHFYSLCKGDRYETALGMFGDSGGTASGIRRVGVGTDRLHVAERVRGAELSLVVRGDDRLLFAERLRREQLLLVVRLDDRLFVAERLWREQLPLVVRRDDRLFVVKLFRRTQLPFVHGRGDRLLVSELFWRTQLLLVERFVNRVHIAERLWRP